MINDNWSEPDDEGFQPYTPHTALERRVAALEARLDRLELDVDVALLDNDPWETGALGQSAEHVRVVDDEDPQLELPL